MRGIEEEVESERRLRGKEEECKHIENFDHPVYGSMLDVFLKGV